MYNPDYVPYFLECSTCHRKILVEIFLIGVSHNAGVTASCADCIKRPLPAEFVKDHPKDAKKIEEWLDKK